MNCFSLSRMLAFGLLMVLGCRPVCLPARLLASDDFSEKTDDRRQALETLRRAIREQPKGTSEVWRQWSVFRMKYGGTQECLEAARLIQSVPSPLDQLKRTQILLEALGPGLPEETVAVLGEQRGRQGGFTDGIVISPDGRFIGSYGTFFETGEPLYFHRGFAWLWDARTLLNVALIEPKEGHCRAIAFSPDGRWFAAAHNAGVTLLDLKEKKLATRVELEDKGKSEFSSLRSLAFSKDGRTLIWGTVDKRVAIWDLSVQPPRRVREIIPPQQDSLSSLSLSPDGRWLALSKSRELEFWDLHDENPTLVTKLEVSGKPVFTSDGCFLFVTNDTHQRVPPFFSFWPLTEKGLGEHQLVEFESPPQSWSLSSDGKALLYYLKEKGLFSVSFAALLKAKKEATVRKQLHRAMSAPELFCTAIFPDGDAFVITEQPREQPIQDWMLGRLRIWDALRNEERWLPKGQRGQLRDALIAPDMKEIFSGGRDGSLRLWNLSKSPPQQTAVVEGVDSSVSSLAMAPQGGLIATGGNWNLRLWDISEQKIQLRDKRQSVTEMINKVVFSPDGRYLTSLGKEILQDRKRIEKLKAAELPKAILWTLNEGKLREHISYTLEALEESEKETSSKFEFATFTPDSHRLLLSSGYGWRLWNLSDKQGKEVHHLFGPTHKQIPAAYSPDGRAAATVEDRGKPGENARTYVMQLWSVDKGKPTNHRATIQLDECGEQQLSFSPDGKYLLSYHRHTQLAIRNPWTGEVLRRVNLHCCAETVHLAPDGRHLITANSNGSVYILRLAEPGQPLVK